MAGRLPGVGLLARKRTEQHHRNENQHHATYRHSYCIRESFEAPWIPVTVLDETALKARQRLHKKLGHFFSSYSCLIHTLQAKRQSKKRRKSEPKQLPEEGWRIRSEVIREFMVIAWQQVKEREKSVCRLPRRFWARAAGYEPFMLP